MKTILRIIGFFLLLLIGLNQKSFGQCSPTYATLPYTQNFESWITLCDFVVGDSLNEPDSSWVNNPSDGNDSWRRNDQGVTAGWRDPTQGEENYVSPPPFSTNSAAFFAYEALPGTIGTLNLYVNCSTGTGTKELSFYYLNPESYGRDSMNVYISTDGGKTFSPSLLTCPGGTIAWTNYTIPIASDSPRVVISFVGTADDGENDMYLDYVQVLPPCEGVPVAGTIVMGAGECVGVPIDLSLTGSTQAAGLSYTWQQSIDSINWSSIGGDTTAITVTPDTFTYYRAIVTCNGSGLSDTSAKISVDAIDNIPASFYRNLPYTQNFESWMCYEFALPDTGWTNNPSTGNDSWRRDDQGNLANWLNNSTTTYITNLGVILPPPSSINCAGFDAQDGARGSKGTLSLYVNCSVQGTKLLSFYYMNTQPLGDDSLNVYVSTDGGATFGPSLIKCPGGVTSWTQYTITIPSNSAKTVISFVGTASGTCCKDLWLDYVYVQVLPECAGKPDAGTVAVLNPCAGTGSLMLSGSSLLSAISYMWQQSGDNLTWSNMPGDTSIIIDTIIFPAAGSYYRAIVTCNNSGLSDTTLAVYEVGDIAQSFYRNIPYTQNFGSWITKCATYPDSLDVPDTGWTNNLPYGDASWRRGDQGTSAGWSNPSNGISPIPPPPGDGVYYAAFDGESADSSVTGTLNLYVNCSTYTGTKELSFYYLNPIDDHVWFDSLNVYVSTDGGLTFSRSLVTCPVGITTWTNYTIPIASNSAQTVISFVATADNGGWEMWLSHVQVLPECEGKPVAGTIVAQNACLGTPTSLLLSGNSQAGFISYKWQQSVDNVNWSTIAGDTTTAITVQPYPSTYYRIIAICDGSGLSDTSAKVYVEGNSTIPSSFYRKVPYTEDFEQWMNRCDTLDVPDTGWINNPVTGNDSWRRDDQGDSAGWTCPTCSLYSPLSISGSYSAAFDASDAATGTIGTLSLCVNCSTDTGTKELSFYYINGERNLYIDQDSLNVYVSTNGGATFSPSLLACHFVTDWTHYTLPIASDSPHVIINFVGTAAGLSIPGDIGLDYVQVLTQCSDKPVAGTVVETGGGCPNFGASLALLGSTQGLGLVYTWQQSGDDINWSSITGDDTTSIIVFPFASIYYRTIVTCTNSGLSDTSAGVNISGVGSFFRSIPYTEDFGQWITRCATYPDSLDVPDTGWTNNPVSGDDSWRQNGQGHSAGWGGNGQSSNFNNPPPYGSYCATFNAYDANQGTTGALDLYVNCSTITGTKELSFYYQNPEPLGDDSLNVYVSTNGGVTFSPLITCQGNVTNWTKYTIPITSNSAETVISFVGTADDGSYDMWLNHVQVIPPCDDKPVAGLATANPPSVCLNETTILTLPGLDSTGTFTGLTYQWQSSANAINWANVTGGTGADSDTYITDTMKATTDVFTFYRCVVTCPNSGESDASQKAGVIYSPLCYCSPQTTVENGDNIGNVTIKHDTATVLNYGVDTPAVQPNLLNTGTPYVVGYDSTSSVISGVVDLELGVTYKISSALITNISGGNFPDTVYAFVDYNQDGRWESSERIWSAPYNAPTGNTPVPTTGTFTVPATADTGYTEMRIQLIDIAYGVDTPCYNLPDIQGETEDFLVHIGPEDTATGVSHVVNTIGSIGVYPDPFSNQVTLYFNGMPAGNFNLTITNTLGQQVMAYSDYTDGNGYKRTIDLHTLPAGLYFISVITNGNSYVEKVVKTD